jgi:hypothetical protein
MPIMAYRLVQEIHNLDSTLVRMSTEKKMAANYADIDRSVVSVLHPTYANNLSSTH